MAVGIAHSTEVMQILAQAWYLFKELTQERRFALRFSTRERACLCNIYTVEKPEK